MPESDAAALDAEMCAARDTSSCWRHVLHRGAGRSLRGVGLRPLAHRVVGHLFPIFRISARGGPVRALIWGCAVPQLETGLIAAGIRGGESSAVICSSTGWRTACFPKVCVDAFRRQASHAELDLRGPSWVPCSRPSVNGGPDRRGALLSRFALPPMARALGPVAAVMRLRRACSPGFTETPVRFRGPDGESESCSQRLRLWSGSLWAAVIGHAVNNGIAGWRSCSAGRIRPSRPTRWCWCSARCCRSWESGSWRAFFVHPPRHA